MAKIGEVVSYADEYGEKVNALVTAVHGSGDSPSINLVFVTEDEAKVDSYGRQIDRATSVVHHSNQAAHGRYWE